MFSKILLLITIIAVLSCSASREIKPGNKVYDKQKRLVKVLYYKNSDLKFTENLSYSGSSKQPYRILYKQNSSIGLRPVKEINYKFKNRKVVKKTFYRYNSGRKKLQGVISYRYSGENLVLIKYFTILKPSGNMFMFALQQLNYSDRSITRRRFIHYTINPENLKSMQNYQYVVNYRKGEIDNMKSWTLDSETKKVIEKNNNSINLITKIIKNLDHEYTEKSSGNGFRNI